MIKKIKSLANTEEKKRLLGNFFSLITLQGLNYIFPLITFPYLVKVLGVENYGLLAFAGAVTVYFSILVDYGFSLTATKEISIYRDDKSKLSEIFSSVILIQGLLAVVSFFILLVLIVFVNKFHKHAIIYLFSFGTVIGQVLFPVWFFQGMEKMKYMTFLNVIAKVIFIICLFIFIKTPEDVYKVPLFNSIGAIVAGMFSLYIIKNKFNVTFSFPTLKSVVFYLKEGWHIFISRVFISGFTNTNTFLIGMFFDNKIVGYYSIADKLISIIKNFLAIISQVLFPYISKLMKENRVKAFSIIKKVLFVSMILIITGLFVLYIISPYIFDLLLKNNYDLSLEIFRIYLIIPFVMFFSTIIGQQVLLPLGHVKLFSNSLIIFSIIHIILIYPVIKIFGILGVVWLVIFTETAIASYRILATYLLKRKGKL